MACRPSCQVTGAPGRARLNVKASTGRQHQRSAHLDVEADAERGHRGAECREPAGFGRAHPEPRRGQQHQDETALGIVGTVDGDIDRAQRERQRGDSGRRPAQYFRTRT